VRRRQAAAAAARAAECAVVSCGEPGWEQVRGAFADRPARHKAQPPAAAADSLALSRRAHKRSAALEQTPLDELLAEMGIVPEVAISAVFALELPRRGYRDTHVSRAFDWCSNPPPREHAPGAAPQTAPEDAAQGAAERAAESAPRPPDARPDAADGDDEAEPGSAHDRRCVVCAERERTHQFSPCSHLCVCSDCADQIESRVSPACPVCSCPGVPNKVKVKR
jgi:hypothetical protein